MKRSSLMRRSPLRARKMITRRAPVRRGRRATKYSRRPRDFAFMGWVKTRPCIVRELSPFLFLSTPQQAAAYKATPCSGGIEADHAGARGIGQKADDRTCIPLCHSHHVARTQHRGDFWTLTQPELRAWRARAIEITQAAWNQRS